MNRRNFIRLGGGAAAMLALRSRAYPFGQSPRTITKFTVPLQGLGPTGIPVLSPNTTKYPGTDYYEVVAQEFKQQIHPGLPNKTTFWGYADAANPGTGRYLGGVIVAKRKRPVKLKMINNLPATPILPFDITAMDPLMAASGRVDRIAVHLHGGLVHWMSDGGPFAWYSNPANGGLVYGSSFLNGAEAGSAIYDYPNDQSARMVWYHDHAYGVTRLNAYAGMASGYIITDDAETQLINTGVLPNIPGYSLGIPLIIQDKTFFDGHDQEYVSGAVPGSLWYPHKYEVPPLPTMAVPPLGDGTGRWDLGPGTGPPPISLVAEAFMDTMLVNGTPYPNMPVAPRRYRFRLLNGSQARFFNIQLYVGDGSADGITLKTSTDKDPYGIPLQIPANAAGPKMIQIGTEGGFLPLPTVLNDPPKPIGYFKATMPGDPKDGNVNRYTLLLAPAERADVIIDFRGFEGKDIIVYNDAPAPFPCGDIRNDYYAGAPNLTSIGGVASPAEGSGPDTRVIMRFRVGANGSVRELSFKETLGALSLALPVTFLLTQPRPLLPFGLQPKVKTLNEDFDSFGRLSQLLGAPNPTGLLDAPTDFAHKGETQMWQIYNTTGDTHPMHFHLVNVQVVKREAFKFDSAGNQILQPIPGSARLPDPNELGWKETVRMNPGEVVTVLMKFDLPPGVVPPSPRLQSSYGVNGAEYVWHCHILEHEEHDMMHALVVTGI